MAGAMSLFKKEVLDFKLPLRLDFTADDCSLGEIT